LPANQAGPSLRTRAISSSQSPAPRASIRTRPQTSRYSQHVGTTGSLNRFAREHQHAVSGLNSNFFTPQDETAPTPLGSRDAADGGQPPSTSDPATLSLRNLCRVENRWKGRNARQPRARPRAPTGYLRLRLDLPRQSRAAIVAGRPR
jgi:hypothetical protein